MESKKRTQRSDVDDAAAAAALQNLIKGLASQQDAREVRIHQFAPPLFPDLCGWLLKGIARGVHQNVDAAKLLQDGIAKSIDRVSRCHIRGVPQGFSSKALNLTTHALNSIGTPAGRNNMSPRLCQSHGKRSAYSRGSTNHHRDA